MALFDFMNNYPLNADDARKIFRNLKTKTEPSLIEEEEFITRPRLPNPLENRYYPLNVDDAEAYISPEDKQAIVTEQRKSRGSFDKNAGADVTDLDSTDSDSTDSNDDNINKNLKDLPDPNDPKLTFSQKLSAGLDKVFNMQENNPEAYRKVMSGLDIYLRGQRGDDLATAILGNSKFNAEQASALVQSSIKANELKSSQMKVLKAEREFVTPDKVEKGELEITKNIIKDNVDTDNLEAVANFVAGKAKELQSIAAQNNLTLGFNEAIAIAYKQLEQTGQLKDTSTFGGTFGKELTINPDAIGGDNTRSLKELKSRPSNKGKTDAEIRAAVEANGLILVD